MLYYGGEVQNGGQTNLYCAVMSYLEAEASQKIRIIGTISTTQ